MSAISGDFYGLLKVLAHLSQVVSLYLIYRALVNVSLTKLCDLAFRDLKQSQEALRKERDFIAGILETSGTLLMVCDAKGRVIRFNRGCERSYRLPGRRNPGPEPLGVPRSAGAERRGPGDLR